MFVSSFNSAIKLPKFWCFIVLSFYCGLCPKGSEIKIVSIPNKFTHMKDVTFLNGVPSKLGGRKNQKKKGSLKSSVKIQEMVFSLCKYLNSV